MRNLVKAITPPFVWDTLSTVKNGVRSQVRSYQGVTTHHDMRQLHEGAFAKAFDRAAADDPFTDPELIRLRVYMAYMLASQTRHVPGNLIFAGISYGVLVRTVYSVVSEDKMCHLIDPFDARDDAGKPRQGYNTEPEYVRDRFPKGARIRMHLAYIPECLPLVEAGRLSFVHLNTGAAEAEAKSFESLYDSLNPGGIMLIDKYAFGTGYQHLYDPIIARAGASIFTLPSGQGVVWKPSLQARPA